MNNLEEMDKFLETYNTPILNQEEIENMNRSNIRNEIESAVKNSQQKTFKEELTPMLLKLFQKIEEGAVSRLIL